MKKIKDTVRLLNNANNISKCKGLTLDFYEGCEYGCLFCFGNYFTKNFNKARGISKYCIEELKNDILLDENIKKQIDSGVPISCGHETDNFQKIEKTHHYMLSALEIFFDRRIPIVLLTRSDLLLDKEYLKILKKLASVNKVLVGISLITLDRELCQILEPLAPSPLQRIEVVKKLKETNVPVFINIRPLIPKIIDKQEAISVIREMEKINVNGYKIGFIKIPKNSPIEYDLIEKISLAVDISAVELKHHISSAIQSEGNSNIGQYSLNTLKAILKQTCIQKQKIVFPYPHMVDKKLDRHTCTNCPSGKFNSFLMENI